METIYLFDWLIAQYKLQIHPLQLHWSQCWILPIVFYNVIQSLNKKPQHLQSCMNVRNIRPNDCSSVSIYLPWTFPSLLFTDCYYIRLFVYLFWASLTPLPPSAMYHLLLVSVPIGFYAQWEEWGHSVNFHQLSWAYVGFHEVLFCLKLGGIPRKILRKWETCFQKLLTVCGIFSLPQWKNAGGEELEISEYQADQGFRCTFRFDRTISNLISMLQDSRLLFFVAALARGHRIV